MDPNIPNPEDPYQAYLQDYITYLQGLQEQVALLASSSALLAQAQAG